MKHEVFVCEDYDVKDGILIMLNATLMGKVDSISSFIRLTGMVKYDSIQHLIHHQEMIKFK